MEREKKDTILGAPEKQGAFLDYLLGCKGPLLLLFFFFFSCHNSFRETRGAAVGEVGQQRPFHLPRHQSSPPPSPHFRGKIVSKGLSVIDRVRHMSMFAVSAACTMLTLLWAVVQCRYTFPWEPQSVSDRRKDAHDTEYGQRVVSTLESVFSTSVRSVAW